jgi:hypothetical protein
LALIVLFLCSISTLSLILSLLSAFSRVILFYKRRRIGKGFVMDGGFWNSPSMISGTGSSTGISGSWTSKNSSTCSIIASISCSSTGDSSVGEI